MHHARLIVLGIVTVMFAASLFAVSSSHPEVGRFLLAQVGSVGLSVGVLPNPYNTLAEQLREREAELNAKEANLQNQSAAIQSQRSESDIKIFRYSAAGSALLFLLVLVNFYLDFRARRMSQLRATNS